MLFSFFYFCVNSGSLTLLPSHNNFPLLRWNIFFMLWYECLVFCKLSFLSCFFFFHLNTNYCWSKIILWCNYFLVYLAFSDSIKHFFDWHHVLQEQFILPNLLVTGTACIFWSVLISVQAYIFSLVWEIWYNFRQIFD